MPEGVSGGPPSAGRLLQSIKFRESFMPTYEYRCSKCGRNFEVFQKITDEPVKTCKECGGEVQKLVSASNFVLKGSGWYKTDYASRGVPPQCEKAGKDAPSPKPACQNCPANTKS